MYELLLGFFVVILLILIFIPSTIFFMIHILLYRIGKKYVEPKNINSRKPDQLISIVIPVKKEPIGYIDDALKNIFDLDLRNNIEVLIVSDDPKEYYLELKDLINKWRNRGLNVYLLWRSEPRGYKAGALNTGLWFARGKYLLVLDVDSRFERDLLIKAYSIMENEPDVVAVVGRWVGKNRDTRVSEAVYASMKFIVDSLYRGRSSLGLPVFPLGSGTMYRVDFLRKKLNGWDEERIQDDLEIGCRIMSLNKKILFLDKDPVYVEIPRRYRSLRLQQDRWVYGATDVAITRFTHLMRSKQPWYAKFDALYYLLQYLPAISTFIGFLILSFIVLLEPQDYIREYWFLGLPWMILAFIYGKYYVDSLREYGYSVWRTIVNLGRSAALTVSLTPTLTKSFFQALLRLKVGFKRTPKGRYEHLLSNIRVPIETIVGLYALFIGINLLINQILYTGGWFLSYSLGYIYATIRWWKDIIYR